MELHALFLCEASLRTAEAWAAAGYTCWCVDLSHPAGVTVRGNYRLVGADIHTWTPPVGLRFAFGFGMPTCTDLTNSGARWWKGKGLRALSAALLLVARCAELLDSLCDQWGLENPNGALSTHWRKPDFSFDPCEYAGYLPPIERIEEAYTKRTCLWTSPGFVMPEKKEVVALLGSKMHKLSPSADRAALRSETPRGFALAMMLANSTLVTA